MVGEDYGQITFSSFYKSLTIAVGWVVGNVRIMVSTIRFALLTCGGWTLILVLCLHRLVALLGVRSQADAFMHYAGGAAVTYVSCRIIKQAKTWFGSLPLLIHAAVAFSFGCTVAVGWELIEFASDSILSTQVQKSLRETMLDLVFGLLGAVSVAGLLTLFGRRHNRQ